MKLIILFVACLFTTFLHAQNKIDISSEQQKLQAVLDDWTIKGASGNFDSLMYYWANDAIILDHGRLINGKEAIGKMMMDINKIPDFKMTWDAKPLKLEVSNSGDMAYIIHGNTMSMPDSTNKIISIRNTAVETWKKDTHGIWKCAVVMMMPDEKQ
jgi:ketosteroid isomerase-like protein